MAQLDILVRAFIPQTIAGLTIQISNGPYAGRSAIPGPAEWPALLATRRRNYLTDQRSFSSDAQGAVRMETFFSIDTTRAILLNTLHRTSPTHSLDIETGAIVCQQTASTVRMQLRTIRLMPAQPPANPLMKASIRLIGMANNPCVTGSPDIDWDLALEASIRSDGSGGEISVDGVVEPFPAFEGYARLGMVPMRSLFQLSPVPGTTPFNLPLEASRRIANRVQI